MEAKAIYDFEASQEDELAFRKGDTLKILNKEDANWFKAELEGRQGYIPSNYVKADDLLWYKGKITRSTAEEILLQVSPSGSSLHPEGAFLIRKSETDDNGHSLSVKSDLEAKILLRDMGSVGAPPNVICKVRAKYNFTAQDEQELGFQKGDVLNILEKVDENWWRGEIHNNVGLVPSTYVQEV